MANRFQKFYQMVAETTGLTPDAEQPALFGNRGGFDLLVHPLKPSQPGILTVTVCVQRAAGPLTAGEIKEFRAGQVGLRQAVSAGADGEHDHQELAEGNQTHAGGAARAAGRLCGVSAAGGL